MKGTTHLSFGVATGIATSFILKDLFTPTQQLIFISTCAVGSILVDIDNDKSMLGNDIKPFSTFIQNKFGHRILLHAPLFLILLYNVFNILINLTSNYIKQRNIVLNIIVCIFVLMVFLSNLKGNKFIKTILLYLIIPLVIWQQCLLDLNYTLYGFIFGYTGHLLLDFMTVGGLPLFYPFRKKGGKVKKYRLLCLKSGVWYETFIMLFIFILFFIGLITYNKYAQIYDTYNLVQLIKKIIIERVF